MDIFLIFGDYIHLLAMVVLLAKLWLTKNCAGISGKTQLLHAIAFTARYMDSTVKDISLYNNIMRMVYLGITYCTVLSIFLLFRKSYDRKNDAFRIELLLLPCAVFGLYLNEGFETLEVLWAFSVYLESVAIVPQVYLVSKSKQIESIVASYVSCLGLYRGCDLLHCLYLNFKHGIFRRIAIAGGIVQIIFYCDFFTRNLPILKPKNRETEVAPPTEQDEAVTPEASCKLTTTDTVLVLPTDPSATEEKVTLLASKEQGTSNQSSEA